jgi:hypothetical protein
MNCSYDIFFLLNHLLYLAWRLSRGGRSRAVTVSRGPDEAAGRNSRLAGSGRAAARAARATSSGEKAGAALVTWWFGPAGCGVGNNGGRVAAGADGASGEGETLSGVAGRLQKVALSQRAVVTKQSTTPLSQWTEGGGRQCV